MLSHAIRTWQLGIKSLAVHPMRSLLTVLGIFIGVASVIWLLAIGEGISRKVQEQIEELGATNIIVRSVKPALQQSSGLPEYGVTRDDHQTLMDTLPTLKQTVLIREFQRQIMFGSNLVDGRLVGCTPNYAVAMRLAIDQGRFLAESDEELQRSVCVLSAEVADKLFPLGGAVGKVVTVEGPQVFTVVGVMKPRMAMAAIGGSLSAQTFNTDVYIPINTFWNQYGRTITVQRAGSFLGETVDLNQLTLQVHTVAEVGPTASVVRDLLARRHAAVEDFAVIVPQELLDQARTTRLMFMVLMGLVAAISLVVGGIGIMNIMLATVTERTREIGIRRALGAKRGDITRQFLVETVALSVVGGLTGILGGLFCPWFVGWARDAALQAFPDAMQGVPEMIRSAAPEVVPWSIPLAFGISVAVGVLFGLYPAIRAAAMDPIEALRHE